MVYVYHYMKINLIICKKINKFNKLLINISCHTRTQLFQKLPSSRIAPAPAPALTPAPELEPESAPVLLRGDISLPWMHRRDLFLLNFDGGSSIQNFSIVVVQTIKPRS